MMPSRHPRSRFRVQSLGIFTVIGALATVYEGCSDDSDITPPATDAGSDLGKGPETSSGTDATSNDTSAPDTFTVPPPDGTIPNDTGADVGVDAALDCANDDDAGNGTIPNNLRCTGLYSDWALKTIASDVMPYTPGYVLWSDGALKSRYIYLPPGQKIDTSDPDEWVFPVGTKTWKEFRLATKRIETRFFMKVPAGWVWTTYRWSADEKSATKLDVGQQNVEGTTYEIPSHDQCLTCHQGRKDRVLGFEAVSLGVGTDAGTTLQALVDQSLLTDNPPLPLEIPEDSTNIGRAPIGWLHANCGIACHNRNPNAAAFGSNLFLRVSATHLIAEAGTVRLKDLDPYVTSVNVIPNYALFASQGYKRIKPADPSKSLIPLFDETRDNDAGIPQMPPIISHIPPTTDVNALKAWITALPDGG
jgi:hypothetical protein